MKILGLKAYRSGYTGFLEESDHYVFFKLSIKGLKKLQCYDKSEFGGYDHFIGLMSKFFPINHFYRKPIAVDCLTMDEVDRLAAGNARKR